MHTETHRRPGEGLVENPEFGLVVAVDTRIVGVKIGTARLIDNILVDAGK